MGDDLRAKREVKLEDWTKPSFSGIKYLWRNVLPQASPIQRILRIVKLGREQQANNKEVIETRCERGANIVEKLGLSEHVSSAIYALDEHWNGAGFPLRLKGTEIPLHARILSLVQTVEVFARERGVKAAGQVLKQRSGKWFDSRLVKAARAVIEDASLWETIRSGAAQAAVIEREPGHAVALTESQTDRICEAFADVVDAKSPFTFRHSMGVTEAAIAIGRTLKLSDARMTLVRRAALLHDIGKLSVPNSILDKPGKLTAEEWDVVRSHPTYTQEVLSRISAFGEIAHIAGAHHEKLDGSGYPNHLTSTDLSQEAHLLVVADIYGALSEERPYRSSLPDEKVFAIMQEDIGPKLDRQCFEALRESRASVGDGT